MRQLRQAVEKQLWRIGAIRNSLRFMLPARRTNAGGAVITVGAEILAAKPERFGANIDVRDYEAWNHNALIFNNWVGDGGMEPIILRYKGTASGGGSGYIENSAGATTAAENTIGDGFFDGAEVRVYRVVAGRLHLLRTNRVVFYGASQATGYRIALDAAGPPVQAGDVYFLSLIRDNAPLDRLHLDMVQLAGADTWRSYAPRGDGAAVTTSRDAGTVAPAHGSGASLRILVGAALEGGIFQATAGSPRQNVYNSFDPAKTYRLELWLKQQEVVGGKVNVWFSLYREKIRHTFSVTGEWAVYSFSFKGPRRLPTGGVAQLHITFGGPGTIWVDDVRLFDSSRPPFAIHPQALAALQQYQPGPLRIWSGQTNTAWGTTLDNWIAPQGRSMRYWHQNKGPIPGTLFGLPTALKLARQLGATPWLIVSPSFDETEWRNLIEYLAGPATSPYGARRAASGQVAPWSDEFAHIRIELGNETWNPIFAPWNFKNGTQYGQFAEYFFGQAKSSPYYAAIANKVDFVLGGYIGSGGPRSYGTRARQSSPAARIICFVSTLYPWDRNRMASNSREDRFRNTLLFTAGVTQQMLNRQRGMNKLLAKTGTPFTLAIAEGGPGFGSPAPGGVFSAPQEDVGKSLAAGVATLDMFLLATSLGFDPLAYFQFGAGLRWSSHDSWRRGHHPHPAWLALQMRNRYARGALLATSVSGGPCGSLPEHGHYHYRIAAQADIPLIAAYAFRDDTRYAIFVISRRLYRGTPVTLHLPAAPRNARLYTLTGDPYVHNSGRLRIWVRRRTLRRFSQDYSFIMPPGSVYLFVVNTQAGVV